MSVLVLIAQLFYFFLPAGVANMSPVFIKNHWQWLAKPVDGGITFGEQPLFGAHKTWRGLVSATIFGGLFWLLEYWLAHTATATVNWTPFDLRKFPWWFGFVFAAGAILGDLVKSFFKRRIRVAPGKTWFPFDQLDFLVGAAVAALFIVDFTSLMWLAIVLVGPGFHILVNHLGFWLKIKSNPW